MLLLLLFYTNFYKLISGSRNDSESGLKEIIGDMYTSSGKENLFGSVLNDNNSQLFQSSMTGKNKFVES